MGLPFIKFNINKNGLSRSQSEVHKIPGLLVTGNTVVGKASVGKSYQLFSLDDAEKLGIDAVNNPFAHKHISAFYDEAKSGAELWVMLVPDATLYSNVLDINKQFATKLLNDAACKIRVLGAVLHTTGTETADSGLLADIKTAMPKAQNLADNFAERYFPVRIIVSGNNFSGNVADLFDYSTTDYSNVSILIANNDAEKDASVGLLLGRLATIPVQRKISRLKDGAIEPLAGYFTNGAKSEDLANAWKAIAEKGYIFLRTFAALSGYYFSSDPTLAAETNDFSSLSRGLVMDKAVIIAYTALIQELNDEVEISDNGTIHPAIVKSWQSAVETQIDAQMTSKKEISAVDVYIDTNQNLVTSDELVVELRILPVGYSEFITVNIGFTTQISN